MRSRVHNVWRSLRACHIDSGGVRDEVLAANNLVDKDVAEQLFRAERFPGPQRAMRGLRASQRRHGLLLRRVQGEDAVQRAHALELGHADIAVAARHAAVLMIALVPQPDHLGAEVGLEDARQDQNRRHGRADHLARRDHLAGRSPGLLRKQFSLIVATATGRL